MGDPVHIVKGCLRVSFRKDNERYRVDVEVWPTDTVLEPNETLVLEIEGHDTQGVGKFSHEHPEHRDLAVFGGLSHIEVGQESGYLLLPLIPSREAFN
ncbi:hypothetical protein BDV33DRAFT_199980 [Aspergillus novoparasiticus]|uniref:Xaa-Pro dipeptidyl-peptidase C-terminal domain-containing protein n=1 Tax=Aspergillus novoparasiticus TaxID=986946 RepID=A0A5N6F3W8_9EURO|nr:hypothetical protein BDV33DRAFT_199980 [Aspergillus novoparasiticus]